MLTQMETQRCWQCRQSYAGESLTALEEKKGNKQLMSVDVG